MYIRYVLALIRFAIIGVTPFLMLACQASPSGPTVPPAKDEAVFIERLPPSSKDAIRALIQSHAVPLGVHASCSGVGTELSDETIGDYISGFLVELDDDEASNTLETTVQKVQSDQKMNRDGWTVRVMIGQAKGEVVWRWGVEYYVRKKDGLVVPDSFRCLGAG